MKRCVNIAFSILCLAMLLLPLLFTTIEEGAVSDVDGRRFAEKPMFGNDGYTASMEVWLQDRLGMRDVVKNAYAVLNDSLFGELINATYQYGKDGYTFYRIHNNIDYGDYHKRFAEMVADMQRYCESRGTKFYYVLNPEKESVYERYLPAGVNYSDEWADRMFAYMDKLGIKYIDLKGILNELSFDEDVFNRQYDAGHWNHNGAFYGTKTLTERMNKDIRGVKILDKDEYYISETVAEKLYGSNQIFNEKVPQYELKATYSDITGDLASELTRNGSYTYFQLIRNDSDEASKIKRMLLFEDDFYAPFAFARSRETAVLSCLQNVISFDYYYNIFKPDVVVFEHMEYVVDDYYFSQAAMEAADYSPAIMKNFPEEGFMERRDALLEKSQMFETDISATVIAGNAIDKVYISREPRNTDYAYLISDSKVIDLKPDENGIYSASIRHGDLPEGSEVVLYVLKNDGSKKYAVIPITYLAQISSGQTGTP